MVVKRRFSAVSSEVSAMPYTCGSCGHEDRAWVRGVGGATRDTGIVELRSGQDAMLREELALEASAASDANAIQTLAIARCPKCGEPGEELAATRRKYAVRATIFGGIGILLGLASIVTRVWIGAAVFPVFGLALAAMVWVNHRWIWETADARTRFLSRDGSPS